MSLKTWLPTWHKDFVWREQLKMNAEVKVSRVLWMHSLDCTWPLGQCVPGPGTIQGYNVISPLTLQKQTNRKQTTKKKKSVCILWCVVTFVVSYMWPGQSVSRSAKQKNVAPLRRNLCHWKNKQFSEFSRKWKKKRKNTNWHHSPVTRRVRFLFIQALPKIVRQIGCSTNAYSMHSGFLS